MKHSKTGILHRRLKYLGALITDNNEVKHEMPATIQFRDSYHPEFSLETLNLRIYKTILPVVLYEYRKCLLL